MLIEESVRTDKRRFARARFQEAVGYQLKEVSHFGGCLACDISEGGLRVHFNDFIPIGSEVLLQMKLRSASKVFDLVGQVKWLQRVPYSDRYQMGLEFVKADSVSQEEIRRFVKSQR